MSLMSRAMGWLAATQEAAAGVTVLYNSVALGGSVSVAAVVGDALEIVPGTNPPTRAEHRERDYLITLEAWVAAGLTAGPSVVLTPAPGDRISEDIDGVTKTFEVVRRGAEPGWRYSDPDRLTYRIHTKPV